MKHLLLLLIKWYWAWVPPHRRRKCLFKVSCSKHVYQVIQEQGLIKGFKALVYRYHNCRAGYYIIEHPLSKQMVMVLPCGETLAAGDMAERFISMA